MKNLLTRFKNLDSLERMVFMIHGITPEVERNIILILKLADKYNKLSNIYLTFDDGLYNQFVWFKKMENMIDSKKCPVFKEVRKIFFISTGIIRDENTLPQNEVNSKIAHENFFNNNKYNNKYNNKSNFMSFSELNYLHNSKNTFLGLHGHYHTRFKNKKLKEKYQIIKTEVINQKNSDFYNKYKPKYFCYPYNDEDILYRKLIIKELQINNYNIFGKDRINIENIKKEIIYGR